MAHLSANAWAEKLTESLDKTLKKKTDRDRLNDNMKIRLKEQHTEIVTAFTNIVRQIQSETTNDVWSAAAEVAGAILG